MNNKQTNKHRVKIGVIIFFGFAVLLAVLSMIDFDSLYAKLSGPTKIPVPEYTDENFYEPDYETDILNDPAYLALDRTLTWVEDGVSEKLFDNNYEKFDIEIINIEKQKMPKSKTFKIRIIDNKLLQLTGGIVQGMSGTPIIQDDKIIGAISHAIENDPTTGYAVFIKWMLEN